jgi:hypothetical protein
MYSVRVLPESFDIQNPCTEYVYTYAHVGDIMSNLVDIWLIDYQLHIMLCLYLRSMEYVKDKLCPAY